MHTGAVSSTVPVLFYICCSENAIPYFKVTADENSLGLDQGPEVHLQARYL